MNLIFECLNSKTKCERSIDYNLSKNSYLKIDFKSHTYDLSHFFRSWSQMETIAEAAKTYLKDDTSLKIDVASLAVNEKTDEFIKHVG